MSLDIFMVHYAKNLRMAIERYPEEYNYTIKELEQVLVNMQGAFERGTFNKDSRAIKATCRELKISFTYKAINSFFGN